MEKQKRKKTFNRINSFFLTIVFVFSSVFILSGCSTPEFFVGVIFRKLGSQFLAGDVSTPVLESLFNEYGMANEHTVSGVNGYINHSNLLGKIGGNYSSSETYEIANEMSEFTHFYYIKVKEAQSEQDKSQFILICASRALSATELGDGTNGTGAGMIVGYDIGTNKFSLRWRQETVNNNRYGTLGLTWQNLSTNVLVPLDQTKSYAQITSNQAYKFTYDNSKINKDIASFNAYIFVGSDVGGNNLGSPLAFVRNFYLGNHVNAMQNDLRSLSDSGVPSSTWKNIFAAKFKWSSALNEREMGLFRNERTYQARLENRRNYYVETYRDYLTILIVKTFVEYNGKWSAEVEEMYEEALGIINEWKDEGYSYPDEMLQGMMDLDKFIKHVTTVLNVSLDLNDINLNLVIKTICDNILNPTIFSQSSPTSPVVEDDSEDLPKGYKGYISFIQSILQQSMSTSSGSEDLISASQSVPISRTYILNDSQKGFNSSLTCSLNSIFFAYRGDNNLFSTFTSSFPGFTILFDTDKENLDKLKNYKFLLYYHNALSMQRLNETIEQEDSVSLWQEKDRNRFVYVEPNAEDLNNGILHVDVFSSFLSTNPKLRNSAFISLRTYNDMKWFFSKEQIFRTELSEIGWMGSGRINYGRNTWSPYVGYFDYVGGTITNLIFDFVELILLPKSESEFALITVNDIWV